MGKYEIPEKSSPQVPDNPELEAVCQWLSAVRFRKRLLGGVDGVDVWEKIGELNEMYQKALAAERMRCSLLLRQLRREPGGARQEETDEKKET